MQISDSWFCCYFFFAACVVPLNFFALNSECYSEIWNHQHHHHHRWIYFCSAALDIQLKRFIHAIKASSADRTSSICSFKRRCFLYWKQLQLHARHRHTHTHTRNLPGARARARSKSYATAATTYFNFSIPIQWTRAQIFDDAENAIDCHIYIIIIARTHRHSIRARHTHGGRVFSDGTLTI